MMMDNKRTLAYLKQLEYLHPQAFKRNYLFYSLIKTKGIMDEMKEFLPWILGFMIFLPLSIVFGQMLELYLSLEHTRSHSFGVLAIMLLFMLYVPFILKQSKHSSHSFYQQHRHTPIKLALLIILQGINIAYIDSLFLQGILFFFAISFGFVRFYKENMFKASTKASDYYALQQLRRACFWSYKQTLKSKMKFKLSAKNSAQRQYQKKQIEYFLDLHLMLYKYEHEFCKTHKHLDLDKYLEDLM